MATETKAAERAPVAPPRVDQRAEAESFDKIRDVLFGNQLREHDRRYARLEERFLKEVANLRAETTTRLEALEKHLSGELASCVERLSQTRQEVTKSERDARQATLDLSKTFASEMHRVHDELSSELTAEVHALHGAKVDRSDLASMLGEVIVRLNAGIEDLGHMQ